VHKFSNFPCRPILFVKSDYILFLFFSTDANIINRNFSSVDNLFYFFDVDMILP
jgi:hypothetical protein